MCLVKQIITNRSIDTTTKLTRKNLNDEKSSSIIAMAPSQHQSPTTTTTTTTQVTPTVVKLTSGTRKLREHELSYFGVSVPKSPTNITILPQQQSSMTPSKYGTQPTTTINNLLTKMSKRNKWQLTNDKPDLLRHSPNVVDVKQQQHQQQHQQVIQNVTLLKNEKEDDLLDDHDDDEPVYENLRKPSSYNRKNDLKRDEMILTELTRAADQILNVSLFNSL